MTQTTALGQERKNQQALNNLNAAQSHDILPNQGSTVPNVMQTQNLLEQMIAAKNSMPLVEPPGEEEISEQMWITSGIIGLLGAIVSGNPAGGIAAGMTAALAVHDRGYDLRQRADCVMELHNQGYSKRAILNWYETGDNKELDKERDNMEKLASQQASLDMQGAQMKQQADFHADAENDARLNRAQQLTIANQAHQDRIAASNAASASGFKQQAMERRQSLMKGATLDADQYRAMTRSKAAAMKAAADMAQGTPISEQQLELMGQLIDAPNASVKLTQTHHISAGAAHGMLDRAKQYLNKNIAGGGDLTDEQASELMDVINAGHAAQEQAYYEQVGSQASQITDPDEWQNFAIATGLSPAQLRRAVDAYSAAERAAKSTPFANVGGNASPQPKSGDQVSW